MNLLTRSNGVRRRCARAAGAGLVRAHPAHGPRDGPGAGPGQQCGPGAEGHRLGRQHRHGQRSPANLRRNAHRGAHAQCRRPAQRLAPAQPAEHHREPSAVPQALRQGLEHGDRALTGELVQQPVCVAAVPQGTGAVADEDHDPAAGGVAEPVRGVQRRRVGVGAAADGGFTVRPLVQMTDLDVGERTQLAEHLLEFDEQPVPYAHRGRGVQDQLQPGVAPGDGPVDGQDQPAGLGAALRRRRLVEPHAQGRRGTPVALQPP